MTHGSFTCTSTADLDTLSFNHCDAHHRPFIHKSYPNARRTLLSPTHQVTFTSWHGIPVTVTDRMYGLGAFVQAIHAPGVDVGLFITWHRRWLRVQEPAESKSVITVSWAITTPWFLRWAEPIISWMLYRLNERQNREDEPVRQRRMWLKERGFSFKSDPPDFESSSRLEPQLIYPQSGLDTGEPPYFKLKQTTAADWPDICPHQGADLSGIPVIDGCRTCKWHGLKIRSNDDKRRTGRVETQS